MAIALIAGPTLRDYIKCEDSKPVCEQSDEQKEKQETEVSSFDAVAPVLQLDFNLEEILFEEATIEHNTGEKQVSDQILEVPQKFLRVLFRRIISPNAP